MVEARKAAAAEAGGDGGAFLDDKLAAMLNANDFNKALNYSKNRKFTKKPMVLFSAPFFCYCKAKHLTTFSV